MSEIMHERRRLLLSTAARVGDLAAVAVTRSARRRRNAAGERDRPRLCRPLRRLF